MIVLYILLAVLVLLFMVTIHEFGHYIAGKILGFKINEFSIGFGPAILSKKMKSGEVFSIRIFPLGGYCAFEGEEGGSENSGAFLKQKPWKRIIVLFNGAFFNFISAIIFTFIMLVSVGYDIPQIKVVDDVVRIDKVSYYDSSYNKVDMEFLATDKIVKIAGEEVEAFSPSYLSSVLGDKAKYNQDVYNISYIRENVEGEQIALVELTRFTGNQSKIFADDVIYKINGINIDFIQDNSFQALLSSQAKNSSTLTLTVLRDGQLVEVEDVNLYEIGFKDSNGNYSLALGVKSTGYKFSFGEALLRCVPYTFGFGIKVLQALGQIVTGQVGLNEMGGTIFTIKTIADLSSRSWTYFLTLLPLIAANLAIFNWLPLPALDGSKILLTSIEWIRGKPLFSQKTENLIHTIGFILLLLLVVVLDGYHIIFGF